jgi:hypothetical protein
MVIIPKYCLSLISLTPIKTGETRRVLTVNKFSIPSGLGVSQPAGGKPNFLTREVLSLSVIPLEGLSSEA